jgi:transcriptional regulator with XRE-family HTH domain
MTLTIVTPMAEKELPALSRRLRQLRDAAGMTQLQLAISAEVSTSLITQVEQGQRDDIKLSTAAALAHALGVTVDALLDEQPKPRKRRKE